MESETVSGRLFYRCPLTWHECFLGVREGINGKRRREMVCDAGGKNLAADIDAVAEGAAAWAVVRCDCQPGRILAQGWVYV